MHEPLKITVILPYPDLAGGIRVALTYALRLRQRGHRVTVVSQPAGQTSLLRAIKLMLLGKKVSPRVVHPLAHQLGSDHRFVDRPRPVVDSDVPDADVVIATWWETAEWVNLLSEKKGKKVHLIQGYEVFPYLPVDRVIRTFHMPLHRIAVSNYIRAEIEKNHSTSGIQVIPISTDFTELKMPKRDRGVPPRIGFLYSTQEIKNSQLAIDSLEEARRTYRNLKGISFGSVPPSKELPLPHWIDFHLRPEQSRIPGIYAQCDAWLFTSRKEGFGLPLIEAMACRTPVIATAAGAAPEIISGRNGWIVEPSPSAFAFAIGRMLTMSQHDWRDFSQNAFETASSWSWDDATSRLELELYRIVA